MRCLCVLLASAAISLVHAAPASTFGAHVLHEQRNSPPHAWRLHSRANPGQVLPVRIGLKQQNLEHAEKYVMDVADPASPNFGKHWTAEQVANTFAPPQETSELILKWLAAEGISKERTSYSVGRNWIQFEATVAETERLLKTEYNTFEHHESGGYRVACDQYQLPQHIRDRVDFVMPTTQLDGLKPIKNLRPAIQGLEDLTALNNMAVMAPSPLTGLTGLANCSQLITIECLRAIYKFPAGKHNHSGNELGIGEWADYLYLPDLAKFFANWTSPKIPSSVQPTFISIDGGKRSNLTVANLGEVVESALDFQTAYSIIYPQGTRLYQVGDSVNVDSVGTFNIFLDALDASYCTYKGGDEPYIDPEYPDPNEGGYTGPLQCGGAPKSNVFSFSYGQIEGALPVFYQQRQCHEWMKLALQGVSVIFASGDSGVANRYNAGYENSCLNAEEGYVDVNGTRFSPSFPVNCPWITAATFEVADVFIRLVSDDPAVGATDLLTSSIHGGEKAVAKPDKSDPKLDFYSGGGFSDVFEMPSYQSSAVTKYLDKYAPKYGSKVFNDSGHARGFPDVAALGLKQATVYLGHTYGVGGTSASAPIVASIVNLLNELRLQAGKGPIGFLNPVFYAHPDAFNDVTHGSNPGCGTDGFPTAPGWDPVTGLGTPDFQKLKSVFLSLP